MEAISRQLKKGVLDILLLKLLAERRMYGYELMAALDARSGGFFAAKEGTLYPVLYRLEDAGHIRSSWEADEGRRGVPRKYYEITPGGIAYLRRATDALEAFTRAIAMVMGEDGEDA